MAGVTQKIYLDLYNNPIVTVTAKQGDFQTRHVNVVCTDRGKQVVLDPDLVSAYVRVVKKDGMQVMSDATILTDGTIDFELTDQMLTSKGKSKADIMLVNGTEERRTSDYASAGTAYLTGSTVISTMVFYINSVEAAIDANKVISTSEYSALTNALAKVRDTSVYLAELDDTLLANERQRQSNETSRQSTFTTNMNNCTTATNNCNNAISNYNTKISEVNTAISNCNTAKTNADKATSSCNTATKNCNDTIATCNTTIEACRTATNTCNSIVDKSGVVLTTQKGTANGVATLDSNSKIPYSQIPMDNIKADIHEVYSGEREPDNNIGSDGDIYMMIIG